MSRQAVHHLIKFYAGKCKIKLSKAHAHNFRHLHAISLHEAGYQVDQIAISLGHRHIDTTRIYTRKNQEDKEKALSNPKKMSERKKR
jgi:integrase/recombinase XerD